jgi:transcriptional regulator with XRE-family HTH domain
MFWTNYEYLCRMVGKSPTGVASELGIASGAPSAWKTKGALPRQNTLKKIADYFNITIDDLLSVDFIEKNKSTSVNEDGLRTYSVTFEGLTAEQAALVSAYIAGLKGKHIP